MRNDEGSLAVHDTARRAAEILTALQAAAGEQRQQVIAVLRAHGEPEPVEITEADMTGLRQAAAELREVFTAASTAGAARELNRILTARARPPRLTTHDGQAGWHVHVDSTDDASWGEWFLTSSGLALALLLAERQAPPAGICASPSCGKPFVNTGRGRTRRYCSPACGTRERVAAHRLRSGDRGRRVEAGAVGGDSG
jgi:predicted RNA-binding Zn ribbon-like protein